MEEDYDDESDFEEERSSHKKRGRPSGNRRFIPLEFAKSHIVKIEDDMRKMHERHVKLMGDMDENYRMIEHET